MRTGDRHVSDEQLLGMCLGVPGERGDREHVDLCAACEDRHAALAGLVAEAADVAAAQADVAFTPERLARQRARILQRLDQDGAPGRVISFPVSHGLPPRMRPRSSTRWIAGAAVAGLLIGVAAGHLAHDLPSRAIQSTTPVEAVESALASDEEFLAQIETALEDTNGVLRPLDDLTPRVWEIAAQ